MKRLLSIILAVTVLVSAGTTLASSQFNDVEGHWAKNSIEAWAGYGVISGYAGGFAPDRQITRGEFAVVLNRLMKYATAAENTFADLDDNFYTDAILKLNKKGVISGYAGNVNPAGQLTREEASVMLCRALGIEPEENLERSFDDSAEISDWSRTYINAMVNKGLLNGFNGKLNPKNTITRAEVVTILNNAVYPVLTSGEKTGMTLDKMLVISAGDVTITDFVANGNVIITEGAQEGTVTFKGTEINGSLKIENQRIDFIKLENTTLAYNDILKNDAIIDNSGATDDKKPTDSGSSSGGGGGGGGGNSTTPTPPSVDYAALNAEMVQNIQLALDDMEQLKLDDPLDGTLTSQEKALMKIVRDCMSDSLKYKNTNVIDSDFIQSIYEDEIGRAIEIYEDLESKGLSGELHGKLVALNTVTINWLLTEFGLLDNIAELM